MKDTLCAIGLVVAFFALAIGGSWLVTAGVLKLICLCFSWEFSFKWATGIWLIMILVRDVFYVGKEKDNE